MKDLDVTSHSCQTTMRLLGDYWTLRIIEALEDNELRFCELQRRLGNLNPVTLTNRLKKLEDAALVTRCEDKVDKISVSYALSLRGRSALPIINAIKSFETQIN